MATKWCASTARVITEIESSPALAAWLRAGHPKNLVADASLVIWLELLRDYPDLWWAAAHRPETPPEALRVLALSDDVQVRWRLALRHKLPTEVRALLCTDSDEAVRKRATRG
jgi:hypothetical protein